MNTRKKALTTLNLAAMALSMFCIGVGVVAILPGGQALIEDHFGLVRTLSYAGWALGLLVLGWGSALAAGLGRPSWKSIQAALKDPELARVHQAVAIGLGGNIVVLMASPFGAVLGDYYTWPVFVGHLVLSLGVASLATFVCLLRLRAFVDDIAPAPIPLPERVSFAEPAGF